VSSPEESKETARVRESPFSDEESSVQVQRKPIAGQLRPQRKLDLPVRRLGLRRFILLLARRGFRVPTPSRLLALAGPGPWKISVNIQ
jgi:hypothetical protein